MTGLPWYAHKLRNYDERTDHLTMRQHGAYRMMMDSYYRRGGPLPTKLEQIFSICKAGATDEQADVSAVLTEFFELREDGWHNKGCDNEIEKANRLSEKRRKSGKLGGKAKAETVAIATAIATASATASASTENLASTKQLPPHTTLYDSTEKKEGSKKQKAQAPLKAPSFVLPNWVPQQPWCQFVEMRKKIRSAPTDHACELLVTALARLRDSGHDPTAVLDQSTRNSWKDVYPIRPNGNGAPNGHGKPRTATQNFLEGAAQYLAEIEESDGDSGPPLDLLPAPRGH